MLKGFPKTFGVCLLALFVSACQQVSLPAEGVSPRLQTAAIRPSLLSHTDPLQQAYRRAIEAAAIFEPSKPTDKLVPVNDGTLLVSLSSCHNCESCALCRSGTRDCGNECASCSRKCSLTPGKQILPSDVWVTPAAELLAACRGFAADNLILRLQQWLGLPPNTNQPPASWKLLSIRVEGADDLFRPCTDPDASTTGPCNEAFPPSATGAHKAWMAGQAFASWQWPGGYPWTRLGYTYNWNPDASSIVGGSEYVIPRGQTINLLGTATAVEACGNRAAQ